MKRARKFTICAPDSFADKIENAYYALTNIDCNFSRFIQSTLNSVIDVSKFIAKQKKNFRHYHWHLLIEDKETGEYYSTFKEFKK